MATIDTKNREIHIRVAYYGRGMAGKTTSLKYLHGKVIAVSRTPILSTAYHHPLYQHEERTISFTYTTRPLSQIDNYKITFTIACAPGARLYKYAKQTVLSDIDGVIFVADINRLMLEENKMHFRECVDFLAQYNYTLYNVPMVLQYNKCDLLLNPNAEGILPIHLDSIFNLRRWQSIESTAITGQGVIKAYHTLCSLITQKLRTTKPIHEETWSKLAKEIVDFPVAYGRDDQLLLGPLN